MAGVYQQVDPEKFEWDPQKQNTPLEKHGIDFSNAIRIFAAPALEMPLNHPTENRWLAIGILDGYEIAVIYAIRNGPDCPAAAQAPGLRAQRRGCAGFFQSIGARLPDADQCGTTGLYESTTKTAFSGMRELVSDSVPFTNLSAHPSGAPVLPAYSGPRSTPVPR